MSDHDRDAASDLSRLGRLLYRARRTNGQFIRDVAYEADLHHSYLSRLEHGQRQPRRETLLRIAEALGLGQAATDEALTLAGYLPSDDGILHLARVIECRRLGAEYDAWHAATLNASPGPLQRDYGASGAGLTPPG